jgi:predicted acyltransferase
MGANPEVKPRAERLLSLDAYRGFVMLAMVSAGMGTARLKGDPKWGWLAHQFDHLNWPEPEGCTFWDLIQPSFMFMVGVSMPFAFAKRQAEGQSRARQLGHALTRALLLILIGVFLDSYSQSRPDGDKVPVIQMIRVLQQIALGYVLAFFVLHLGPRMQFAAAVLLLAGHSAAYLLYGGSQGAPWAKDQNVGTLIDRWLREPFVGVWWADIFPPSTGGYVTFNAVSSAATILFGVLCGWLLRSEASSGRKVLLMLAAGVAGLALGEGLAATGYVPMIKRLWTASFAVYAAGWTFLMMAAFYAIIDVIGWRGWSFPLAVVGLNSIFIYVTAGVLTGPIRRGLQPFADPWIWKLGRGEPVLMAFLILLVQWGLCYWLYRHRIFFKV